MTLYNVYCDCIDTIITIISRQITRINLLYNMLHAWMGSLIGNMPAQPVFMHAQVLTMHFIYRYADRGFITLFGVSLGWQLRVDGSLLQRADTGLVNTPPVSRMLPVVRLQEGCGQTIRIPGKLVMAR